MILGVEIYMIAFPPQTGIFVDLRNRLANDAPYSKWKPYRELGVR